MNNRENRYEQLERQAEKKTSGARVRDNADNVVKTRRAKEASSAKETRQVVNPEKKNEQSKINKEVKHIESDKVSRVNPNEAASLRRSTKDGDSNAIKRRETLINKIKETPDFEKQNFVRKQMGNSRLSANEIADMRRKSLNEVSDKTTVPKELIHKENYNEFKEKAKAGQLEIKALPQQYIKVDDIMRDSQWNENNKDFWQHHGNTFKDYNEFANKYPAIKERLAQGETLEDLKKDHELKSAVNFWWSGSEKLELAKFKDSYFVEKGFHRVELAKNHKIDEIPAYVNEAMEKEKEKKKL